MDVNTLFGWDQFETVNDTWNGEAYSFDVRVRPGTLRFGQLLNEAQESPEAYAELMEWFVPSWNIQMDGQPFPATAENYLRVPKDFVDHLFEKATQTVADLAPTVTFLSVEEKADTKKGGKKNATRKTGIKSKQDN